MTEWKHAGRDYPTVQNRFKMRQRILVHCSLGDARVVVKPICSQDLALGWIVDEEWRAEALCAMKNVNEYAIA